MKKYLVFILLILLSCQKDEIIVEPTPQYTFIFEAENIVRDNQDIYFKATTNEQHQLIILQDNSVITKELFNTEIGLNKRKIFTKTLNKGKYKLVLLKGFEEINSTFIIVE